jgi:ATP-dependent DNA helicase DinG
MNKRRDSPPFLGEGLGERSVGDGQSESMEACRRMAAGENTPDAEQGAPLADLVEADLRAGGVLAHALPGYEERPAQIAMARVIAEALEDDSHAALEASTGTGKSLAYLLPIVRSNKVALVSTANKALQEQLFYKDIPFVQRHVRPFKAALVKGMGNYLCLDRLEQERSFLLLAEQPQIAELDALIQGDAWDGDLDMLPESLPPDMRGRINGDSDQCAWRACPSYADCYVRKMRERARDAQVIVVNHTLLLLDAAMDGWLLPERDLVILDEAHHLEEEATRAFTVTVSPGRVNSLLALRRLREHADAAAVAEAQAAVTDAWDALRLVVDPTARDRQTLRAPLEQGLRLASLVDDVATSLKRNQPQLMDEKEEQLYERLVKRARTLAADLRVAFGVEDLTGHVYYVERSSGWGESRRRGVPQPSVSATPLGVATLLTERLFDKIPVLATSATLAIGGDFSFFRARVGFPAPPLAREAVLPLAFDYETHALLYAPRLRHEPAFGDAGGPYLTELAEHMSQLVRASAGRAFLLFSSQRALGAVLERLAGPLDAAGFSLLAQGAGMARAELLRRFREEPRAVLFGLKSFWEGVDVAGAALSLVVIDKLPFAPPDDPIQEARVALMKEAGENWFGGYTLPLAILQLKQGLGRLLRTRDDRGVMAILDTRLHTKSYGRQVLMSLPPARRTASMAEVARFFEDG